MRHRGLVVTARPEQIGEVGVQRRDAMTVTNPHTTGQRVLCGYACGVGVPAFVQQPREVVECRDRDDRITRAVRVPEAGARPSLGIGVLPLTSRDDAECIGRRGERGGVVATLGLIGLGSLKKGSPPVPEQAIQEAKRTTEAIRA